MVRALKAALVLVLIGLLTAPSAGAEPGFEYGEVARFGGFDSSAYNAGQYGGPLTPGRFLDPTGFAVDPVGNGMTTVYVVDRTSSRAGEAERTAWRIQQFSSAGVLLGTTTFTLPNSGTEASAIEGLAVDHHAGRLYALLAGSPPHGEPFAIAQELLAWSTTPVAGGLVAANVAGGAQRLPLDQVSAPVPGGPGTVGGVISTETQLRSGATPLYGPQGIAVDPVEAPGVDNPVAIEASDNQPGAGAPVWGDTVVQLVATQPQQPQAAATGDLLASWSGASVAGLLRGISWGPLGISASPDGTLTVLLDVTGETATSAYAVQLKADLSESVVLDSDANVPPLTDFDEALMNGDPSPFYSLPGVNVSDLRGAGPQLIRLSATTPGSGAGPYAAVIFTGRRDDNQVPPPAPAGSEYWTSGEEAREDFEANIGVRLLEPREGAIADLQGRTIVNTLGNGSESGPCKIGASAAALAAGADGALWILDRGPRAGQPNARGQGREVIELAPGTGQLCPQPSGTFTMTPAGGGSESGEETLTVPAGTQVTFDASSINRKHGKPFAYEWDLDGNVTNGPAEDGFEKVYEMTLPHYYYPPSHITYMYTRPGEYKVRVRMRTDYGVYAPPHPATVVVTKALIHPEARFTATPSGQQVTFNATDSVPGVGTIVDYRWNWGDGSEEDEGPKAPVVVHTYAEPRQYQVTLTVVNSAYQSATSAPQVVTVTAPARPAVAPPPTGPLYAIPPLALYPIPAPPTDREPTRLPPRARFGGGALSVTLACPATKVRCAGTVSIETAAALAAKVRKGRPKPSRLLLARAAFSIPGGHSATVKVRLSKRGMALLKGHKRLKVLVTVAAHDSFGDPGTATLKMTLKAPTVHRH